MREAMEAAKTTTKKATVVRFIKRSQLVWLLALFLVATAAPQTPASPSEQKRVSPDAYGRAPAAIRAALKKQHCELPETQHWDETQLNIVQGHFADSAQNDWAAICIAPDGSMRALVFWGKSAPCPAEIRHGWSLKGRFPPGQAGSLYLLKAPPSQITAYRKFFELVSSMPFNPEGASLQGLKPACLLAPGGTAEAVPFPKPFMKPVLR